LIIPEAAFGGRIRIAPGQRIGLDLTPDERQLLLDMTWLDEDLAARIRSTLAGEPNVMLSLNDLDLLDGDIAAEANHTTDMSLQKKLDAVSARIDLRLRLFTDELGVVSDETGPDAFPFQLPEAEQHELRNAALLAVGVIDKAEYLNRTRRKKVKPDEAIGLRLTKKQRQALLDLDELPVAIAARLRVDSDKTETTQFTMDELGLLRRAVVEAEERTSGNAKGMLSRIKSKIKDLLLEHVVDDT
jgi:hypothetical protein